MDKSIEKDNILIISNNPFSKEKSNGKTLLSLIKNIDKNNIRQLYFSSEMPTIGGYNYFQLSDKDVLKGKFIKSNRGRVINDTIDNNGLNNLCVNCKSQKISDLHRLLREGLWYNSWCSTQLDSWIEEFKPNKILLLGGDCLFAYSISEYIKNKTKADLYLYITDDYVDRPLKTGVISFFRSKIIKSKIKKILYQCKKFFTISQIMREEYKKIFGMDSEIIYNSVTKGVEKADVHNEGKLVLTYAGSLYYGRDKQLLNISRVINEYAKGHNNVDICFNVYSNNGMDENILQDFNNEYCHVCNSLLESELINVYQKSDILVFVESFDEQNIEKVKLSFSTKIPEYLSMSKPILAVGPKNIGSMIELEDVAVCVNSQKDMKRMIYSLLDSKSLRENLSQKARSLYRNKFQPQFLERLL